MAELTYRQFRWQRFMQHIPASALGAAAFSKFLHHVDPLLMRISGDRLSIPAIVVGLPVVLLTSKGAKSGKERTMPVIGVPDNQNVVLVASNWGQPKNPAWYHNLKANPIASLEFNGQSHSYTAREVTDTQEYKRLWERANNVYIGFDKYQQRASNRLIPLMVMEPHIDNS